MTRLSVDDVAYHARVLAALHDAENARAQIRLLTDRVEATEQLAERWRAEIAKRYELQRRDHVTADGEVRRTRFVPTTHTSEQVMLDTSPRYFPVHQGSLTVTVLAGDTVLVDRSGSLREGEPSEFRVDVRLSSRSTSQVSLVRAAETAVHPDRGAGPILTADGWQH